MTDLSTTCVNCNNLLLSIARLQDHIDAIRDDHEAHVIRMEQEILDLRRANRANKSRWKNARRDFLLVRSERDSLLALGEGR